MSSWFWFANILFPFRFQAYRDLIVGWKRTESSEVVVGFERLLLEILGVDEWISHRVDLLPKQDSSESLSILMECSKMLAIVSSKSSQQVNDNTISSSLIGADPFLRSDVDMLDWYFLQYWNWGQISKATTEFIMRYVQFKTFVCWLEIFYVQYLRC